MEDIFKNLKIVELASVLAGPAAGMFFSELGAKVYKIENRKTGGDVTRRWKHPVENVDAADSAYYHSVNYNKEVIFLDLTDLDDRETAYELIENCDIVLANFKPGSEEKLGMSYEQVSTVNPNVIYANVTAYGDDDSRPGFDAMMQAESGWMYMNGQKDGPPTKVPLAIIDLLAGHQLKEGILVALLRKASTGMGGMVSVSLYDTALSALANQASSYLNLGVIPTRMGSRHPSIAPYGDIVQTQDEVNYMLAAGTNEQFESLCNAIALDSLSKDRRFDTNESRLEHRDALMNILCRRISNINSIDFESQCAKEGVPIGRIRNLAEVFEDKMAKSLILSETMKNGEIKKKVKTAIFKIENGH